MHHLKDARQQRGGLKRAHALLLQQVGQRVDFGGQFAQRIRRAGSARAKGVVALAQRRDNVGQRLQRADQAVDQRGGDERKVNQQAGSEQKGGGEADARR